MEMPESFCAALPPGARARVAPLRRRWITARRPVCVPRRPEMDVGKSVAPAEVFHFHLGEHLRGEQLGPEGRVFLAVDDIAFLDAPGSVEPCRVGKGSDAFAPMLLSLELRGAGFLWKSPMRTFRPGFT